MFQYFIILCIYLVFYVICGYATTDILRLLKGSNTNLWESNCFCPICNHKISFFKQIPILSYLIFHGKCSKCGSKIPKIELFTECFIFISLSVLSTLLHFSWYSYFLSFFLYEVIKLFFVLFYGIRETAVIKNLLFSFVYNLVLWFFVVSISYSLIYFLIIQFIFSYFEGQYRSLLKKYYLFLHALSYLQSSPDSFLI